LHLLLVTDTMAKVPEVKEIMEKCKKSCQRPSVGAKSSQVARAGHSSGVLEPLKTHQEQAILR